MQQGPGLRCKQEVREERETLHDWPPDGPLTEREPLIPASTRYSMRGKEIPNSTDILPVSSPSSRRR
jgi:hypothetical protein